MGHQVVNNGSPAAKLQRALINKLKEHVHLHHQSQTDESSSFLSYSLADARGIHLEESVVHEEVKSLLLPGPAGVLVPAEAAQELDASAVTGSVVSAVRASRETDI